MSSLKDRAAMTQTAAPPLRCREIVDGDLPALADLLLEGFSPRRRRAYWVAALETLRTRRTPDGHPRYGYVLDDGGTLVGVVLLISAEIEEGGERSVRCNVSSWYVRDGHRPSAAFLISRALRHKAVSYVNVSAAPHTLSTVEAQGYRRYADGQTTCVPALSRGPKGAQARAYRAERDDAGLSVYEAGLMADHARAGCVCAVVEHEGRPHPFVFLRRRIRHRVPVGGLQLAWERESGDFVRFAGGLGRFLLTRGGPLVVVDGPAPGLVGVYEPRRAPKFVRGPHTPRLNDLAYTEGALFGG